MGVQPQAVYLWERGRRLPQVPQLRKLGSLFGICSDEIVLLEPSDEAPAPTAHRARADRHPRRAYSRPQPGWSRRQRAVTRPRRPIVTIPEATLVVPGATSTSPSTVRGIDH